MQRGKIVLNSIGRIESKNHTVFISTQNIGKLTY
jgi:hypothetical protein